MRQFALAPLASLFLAACATSNPYGHAREYLPRDDEETYYERAQDVSYEDVRRDPQGYSSHLLGWFGVVTAIEKKPDGETKLALELRFHQPRHLCSDQFEDSCRVTVSIKGGGPFSTTVKQSPEQVAGFGASDRLNVGSLVKVYGNPTGELDERGGPVIKAQWYRYWPHGAFVTTTGNNNNMRR